MAQQYRAWWQDAVIYQIYPRSFADTNNDGVGDLPGIQSHLDHLVSLGVDALWISPFYPSPMADFGYDVADYTGVDPLFGTLADFDSLLQAAHARNLRVIVDFVPNHSSDQHPWFLESRTSRTDPKRDWYLWRDPAPDDGSGNAASQRYPNNWMSNFGGPGWTWDEATQQFYYHSFLREQPDLNWRNPAVKAAIFQAMRFWLDRGVDGFRMDVLWLLIKDSQFRDNPPNPDWHDGNSFHSVLPAHTANQPETHAIVQEMRALLDSYPGDRVLIGEIYLPIPELVTYYGAPASPANHQPSGETHLSGAQMPFNFHLILTAWQAPVISALIQQYEAALPDGAWPNWVLGNHDQHRLATRVGAAQARVAAVLLLTLRGTPTLYYGDELGMPDAVIAPSEVQDPAEKNQPGLGRDPERSPMLWTNAANAGFTAPTTRTWLPLVQNWPAYTVESEGYYPESMLALYRRLLALRRATPSLHRGSVEQVESTHGVLSYIRSDGQSRYQVHLNLTGQPETAHAEPGRLVLTSYADDSHNTVGGTYGLRPNEAVIVELL